MGKIEQKRITFVERPLRCGSIEGMGEMSRKSGFAGSYSRVCGITGNLPYFNGFPIEAA